MVVFLYDMFFLQIFLTFLCILHILYKKQAYKISRPFHIPW